MRKFVLLTYILLLLTVINSVAVNAQTISITTNRTQLVLQVKENG